MNEIEEENKFFGRADNKFVSTIVLEASNEDSVILNPPYQRGIVWTEEKMSLFINSVMRGIVPIAIIFNHDYESNKLICVDGKQRITSLIKFKNNEIPAFIDKEILFYSKIGQDRFKGNENCRAMTNPERAKFDGRTIPITVYTNLSYEDQINIFQRIQNGLALSKGEMVASAFLNDKLSTYFSNFCETNYFLVAKYAKNKKRKQHVELISHIFYLANSPNSTLADLTHDKEFLSTIKHPTIMLAHCKNTKKIMEVLFNERLLRHHDFEARKVKQNVMFTFQKYLMDKYDDLNKLTENDYAKLRYTFRETADECFGDKKIGSNKTQKAVSLILKKITGHMKHITKDNKLLQTELDNMCLIQETSNSDSELGLAVSEEQDDESSEEAMENSSDGIESDESEQESESEEEVITVQPKKNKSLKTIFSKNTKQSQKPTKITKSVSSK